VRMAAKIDEIDARIVALRRMRGQLARVVGCACRSLDHCTCGAAYLARRGGEPAVRPTLLHVTNGESAGNTLRQTALGGAVLPWQDALHAGPVPALPRRELLRARARFLADCGWGPRQALLSSFERRDRQLLEAFRDDARVVLWFEHDLYDQLQLLDVLALAQTVAGAPELIVIGSFAGKPSFAGLGELTANELEAVWPSRRPAEPAVLGTAAAVWAALRAPEPTSLAEWARQGTADLPFLAAALGRLLEELPAPTDGLSRTERHALEVVDAGARTPPAAFVAAQRLEDAPFLGDTWFYRSLCELGQGTNRLLETDDGTPLPPPPPLGDSRLFARLPLRLTRNGERTLRGDGDRVELLGIRPLDRRHPPHPRQHLALAPRRARARSAIPALAVEPRAGSTRRLHSPLRGHRVRASEASRRSAVSPSARGASGTCPLGTGRSHTTRLEAPVARAAGASVRSGAGSGRRRRGGRLTWRPCRRFAGRRSTTATSRPGRASSPSPAGRCRCSTRASSPSTVPSGRTRASSTCRTWASWRSKGRRRATSCRARSRTTSTACSPATRSTRS
jgi:hypothetical protein